MTTALDTIALPEDLAPTRRAAVERLLAEVGQAAEHPDPREGGGLGHRCCFCHQRGGKLTGHHVTPTRVVWCHRSCHRKAHRAGRA